VKNLSLSDYTYTLPASKIASHGLQERGKAKLLKYEGNIISHHIFHQITDLLPSNATLYYNDTQVVQARLLLKRDTGAVIEVFLLSPANPNLSIYDTISQNTPVVYTCMIGNLKKWREKEILTQPTVVNGQSFTLKVRLLNRNSRHVEFSWDNKEVTFGEILEAIGHTPLPPYIKRADEKEDKSRYQTVYSKLPGAVAAPTAGLHFTKDILTKLQNSGIKTEYLTLHVSAGTFQPIKGEIVNQHPMHSEQIIISKENLRSMLSAEYIIAVGTTAMRTLESTYWFGVQLLLTDKREFHIAKLAPYNYSDNELPTLSKAVEAVLDHMQSHALEAIKGDTEIFIMPGYQFRVCRGLITNFHQPGSTLILLVAAFVGKSWQEIYASALSNNYRFLSYGDSTLLLK
jgi:S-adenosylmethionine:tRNA ribosyltransferase-isomerase